MLCRLASLLASRYCNPGDGDTVLVAEVAVDLCTRLRQEGFPEAEGMSSVDFAMEIMLFSGVCSSVNRIMEKIYMTVGRKGRKNFLNFGADWPFGPFGLF